VKTLNQIIHKAVKLVAVALFAGSLSSVVKADSPTISGFVDTTYNYNFNKPKDNLNVYRMYDRQTNTFLLNLVHLGFTGSMGNVGYNIEIDGGNDTSTNNAFGTSNTSVFDVQEAYLTYKCDITKLNLKAGKFATTMGIEVIESKDNPTISRGYLYHFAEPYTHVGAMVSYPFSDKIDLGLGLVNGWDNAKDNNSAKTALAKLGLNFGDPLALTVSASHGSEKGDVNLTTTTTGASVNGNNRTTIDITGVTKIIPKVALWFQYLNGTEKEVVADANDATGLVRGQWSGFGVQPVVSFTDKFSLGTRVEYFDDEDGLKLDNGGAKNTYATNFTITPAYKMAENFLIRAEYRYDTANKKVFMDDKGVAKDTQSVGTLQFVVNF